MAVLAEKREFIEKLRDPSFHYYDPYHGQYTGNGVVEVISGVRCYSDPAHRQMYPIQEMAGTIETIRFLDFPYNMTRSVQENFELFKTHSSFSLGALNEFEALFEMLTPEHKIWKFSAFKFGSTKSAIFPFGGKNFSLDSYLDAAGQWKGLSQDNKTDLMWRDIFGAFHFNSGCCLI